MNRQKDTILDTIYNIEEQADRMQLLADDIELYDFTKGELELLVYKCREIVGKLCIVQDKIIRPVVAACDARGESVFLEKTEGYLKRHNITGNKDT